MFVPEHRLSYVHGFHCNCIREITAGCTLAEVLTGVNTSLCRGPVTKPMRCSLEVWGHTLTQHLFNFRRLCFEWKSFPWWLRLSSLTFIKSYVMNFWQREKICCNWNLFKQVCVLLPTAFPHGFEMFHFSVTDCTLRSELNLCWEILREHLLLDCVPA